MTNHSGSGSDPIDPSSDSASTYFVKYFHSQASVVKTPVIGGMKITCPGKGPSESAAASKHGDAETPSGRAEVDVRMQSDARTAADDLTMLSDNPGQNGAATPASIVALPTNAVPEVRDRLVRERINVKARPILEGFARRLGIALDGLQESIDGPTPLADPEIMRRLGGALHSEEMRGVIASNADLALVPLNVRAGVAKMMAQNLSEPPPAAVREAFCDWNKPLAPMGRRLQPWRPQDAAAWLERFPPSEDLLHPLEIWDGTTAALWLNDREAVSPGPPCEGALNGTVVVFEPRDPWLPSLEVLRTLHEIELEELTYRVFVERLRREVMPFYLSERRVHIQRAVELVTFGYQTLPAARRSMRIHDLRWTEYFNQVFGENDEWINDLCRRIVAGYVWPVGFAEPELWSDFPDLDEAPH